MELRLLTTEREREIFAQRLAEARTKNGASFRDVERTRVHNRVRLEASCVYALFEAETDPAPRMVAGAVIHDLEAFPQSCSKPDLSHLPPRSVLECSDHWSLSRGAGMHSWRGLAIQLFRRNPGAVLVYLAAGSSDHCGFYSAMGFVKAGEIVEHPHLEGPDDGKLWVQPMVLAGDPIARLMATVRTHTFDALDNYRIVRFSIRDRLRPDPRIAASDAGASRRMPVRAGIGHAEANESSAQIG